MSSHRFRVMRGPRIFVNDGRNHPLLLQWVQNSTRRDHILMSDALRRKIETARGRFGLNDCLLKLNMLEQVHS